MQCFDENMCYFCGVVTSLPCALMTERDKCSTVLLVIVNDCKLTGIENPL